MNNRRRNYRIVLWTMILGSLILDMIRVRMVPGVERDIVRYIGVGLLVVAVVQLTMGRTNSWFKDKVARHPEEGSD